MPPQSRGVKTSRLQSAQDVEASGSEASGGNTSEAGSPEIAAQYSSRAAQESAKTTPLAKSSQSYLSPATFAPPFYNRPPTPLPPSPSLTSLLRPPFSAHTSRPTTPDSSDTEAINLGGATPSTAAAIKASARNATTVPRASPQVPTYEYYGFVVYLGSSLAFLVYLLWSYLPTPFLHKIGIYYYPDRWWSLAIPSWIVMSLVWIYVALAGYNTGTLTLDMSNLECLVDDASDVAAFNTAGNVARDSRYKPKKAGTGRQGGRQPKSGQRKQMDDTNTQSGQKLDWKQVWSEGTDGVLDIPIGGVCEVLYGAGRHVESSDNDSGDEH